MGWFDKGVGGFVSHLFGSDNTERAAGYNVNSNAYNYGGKPGMANQQANAYTAQGANAQDRAAPQAANVGVNYGQANYDRQLGQQARQGQNTLAGIMSNRAQGLAGPSIAQQQADRQMQQSQAQQASLAGSARGAGGLAAAQRTAAFNNANAAADISGQAQINAAGERRDDTNAAAGMYGQIRGGDLGSQGQAAGQAQFGAQLGAQQNQFNAGLQMQNRSANDAYQQNYDQMANQVRTTQLAAKMNQQGQQSANTLGAQGINAGVGGQNASMNQANGMQVLGLAQSGAGLAFGGAGGTPPGRAHGGPVGGAKPYLVGEQGPELVVPRHDGYVLTAEQTQQALGHSPASTINHLFGRGEQETRSAPLASIMGARALGGPVEGNSGASPMLGVGPENPPNPMSTWGTGNATGAPLPAWDPNALDALQANIDAQQLESRKNTLAARQDVANIDERDKNAIWNADYKDRHGQQLTKEEQDAEAEGRYRQDLDKKDARDKSKATRKRGIADILGDNGKATQQAAASIDTSYHGGGGHYVPPQMVQLAGARAMGGPMVAGGLVPLGPQLGGNGGVGGGVEYGGGGITHDMLLKAGSGLASPQAVPGMIGGGGITGGASMGGARIPGFGGAREDGGPIEGAESYDPSGKMSDSEYDAYKGWLSGVADDAARRDEWRAGEPAGEPPPPPAKPKKEYTYDASRPFGDRFQPKPERQMTSFTRTDPEKERQAQQAAEQRADYKRAVDDLANHATIDKPYAGVLGSGVDAAQAMAPPQSVGDKILEKAAIQSLLAGPAVGAPGAAAGIAHLINSYFSRRGGK